MEKRKNRKMERIRKPFQGVTNIIRFNWHFYVLSAVVILLIFLLHYFITQSYHIYLYIFCVLIIISTSVSLLVSFYVYDVSNLYTLDWLDTLSIKPGNIIININAGFDETSFLLKSKYPANELHVFDFYDERVHTEVSIKRATLAYPPYPNTILITTASIPLADNSIDNIFLTLAAHEIRNNVERINFFKQLKRISKPDGKIIVTEHLRDWPNFLAYTVGFFHFHSRVTWLQTFNQAGLKIINERTITPFIKTFILDKNGATT